MKSKVHFGIQFLIFDIKIRVHEITIKKKVTNGSLCSFDVKVRVPGIAGDSPDCPRTSQRYDAGRVSTVQMTFLF